MKLEVINNRIYLTGGFNIEQLHYMVDYLIGFGDNAVIEHPEILKKAYLKKLNKILHFYK